MARVRSSALGYPPMAGKQMPEPPPRILVIEDDDLLGEIIEEVMRDEGYEVRLVTDGRDGLAAMQHWAPAVVLLDISLPSMDAYELRRRQRELAVGETSKIVVLSAARDVEAAAARLGADAFLPKPFGLSDIVETVARLLRA